MTQNSDWSRPISTIRVSSAGEPANQLNSYFERSLQHCPVIAILRGLSPVAATTAARQLSDVGVDLIEVTIQDNAGLRCLEAVAAAMAAAGREVGAGSVTSVSALQRAVDTGAAFAVSPGLDVEIVNAARTSMVPYLPAVATPSELQLALAHGLTELKLFPARQLGGPSFVRAMAGPFPGAFLVPTGGVTLAEVDDYLAAGAIGVGLGADLTQSGGLVSLRGWLNARQKEHRNTGCPG